jgi:hypothetical protein
VAVINTDNIISISLDLDIVTYLSSSIILFIYVSSSIFYKVI